MWNIYPTFRCHITLWQHHRSKRLVVMRRYWSLCYPINSSINDCYHKFQIQIYIPHDAVPLVWSKESVRFPSPVMRQEISHCSHRTLLRNCDTHKSHSRRLRYVRLRSGDESSKINITYHTRRHTDDKTIISVWCSNGGQHCQWGRTTATYLWIHISLRFYRYLRE